MTDDFRAQLALLVECSFCEALPGEKCDIEGKRKAAGDPARAWIPFWERNVHYMRARMAEEQYADLPALQVAMLLAMAKANGL